MPRGQEVSAGGGEEITAGEQPRADMLSGTEGPLPSDIHEVVGAGAAHSGNAGFGKRGREPVAEQSHLIGERHLVEGKVIGMDVHVPEARHQIPAFKIDHLRVAGAIRLSAWQDGADTAILDQHGTIWPYLRLDAIDQVRMRDAIDQVRMRKDYLHEGLFRLQYRGADAARAFFRPKRRIHQRAVARVRARRPRLAGRARSPCAGISCWQTIWRSRQSGSADIFRGYRRSGRSAGIQRPCDDRDRRRTGSRSAPGPKRCERGAASTKTARW